MGSDLRELSEQIAAIEARILRWMFTLWATTMVALAGLLFAVLRSQSSSDPTHFRAP
jgi:hypothetical protein